MDFGCNCWGFYREQKEREGDGKFGVPWIMVLVGKREEEEGWKSYCCCSFAEKKKREETSMDGDSLGKRKRRLKWD